VELRDFNLENPMTEEKLPLAELLAEAVLQMRMEADLEGLIGADR
jgi:hypothetical protein